MLAIDSIYKSFQSVNVLQGVSIDSPKGELLGLIGPTGSGKSTLLKIIAGILSPDRGNINLFSRRSDDESEEFVKNGSEIGFLFQEGALFDSMTVLENAMFPLIASKSVAKFKGARVSKRDALDRACSILSDVGLIDASSKLPGQLSGGMRRRVALARALITEPDIALLDEPTGGLDPVTSNRILDLVQELHSRLQANFVIVSHDLRRLIPRVDRTAVLFNGELKFCGTKSELLSVPSASEVNKFISKRFDIKVNSHASC